MYFVLAKKSKQQQQQQHREKLSTRSKLHYRSKLINFQIKRSGKSNYPCNMCVCVCVRNDFLFFCTRECASAFVCLFQSICSSTAAMLLLLMLMLMLYYYWECFYGGVGWCLSCFVFRTKLQLTIAWELHNDCNLLNYILYSVNRVQLLEFFVFCPQWNPTGAEWFGQKSNEWNRDEDKDQVWVYISAVVNHVNTNKCHSEMIPCVIIMFFFGTAKWLNK